MEGGGPPVTVEERLVPAGPGRSGPGRSDSGRPSRFPCFDGLRAMAAVLVVLLHTSFLSGFTERSPYGIYTSRFDVGVSVFFLISGFLLYRPFAVAHLAGTGPPSTGRFWVRRLLRILPGYWLAFIVTSYVLHTNTVLPGWRSLLIYLGLVQIYFGTHAATGLTQAWTLCTEMSFYLFLPLYAALVAVRRRAGGNQLAWELGGVAVLFVVGLGVRFWLLHVHATLAYEGLEWLPACLDLFALGMLLAVTSSWLGQRRSAPRWLWHPAVPWASWAVAGVLLWAVAHIGLSIQPVAHPAPVLGLEQQLLYGLFAFFLLVPAVFGPQDRGLVRRVLQWRPVAALGIVSYGVYLWHQAWETEFLDWTHRIWHIPFGELAFVVLTLATVSAAVSYLVVERPALLLKNRIGWWSRRSRPARAVPPLFENTPLAEQGAAP
ncbi:MAG TPA: acyltransferase [Acidimicrobiales bacterium]|nr:acyltransferase [Acidimicrobiales bacterium]